MSKEVNAIKLPNSVQSFLSYLHMKNKSENTIKGYNSDLKVFFRFIKQHLNKKVLSDNTLKQLKLEDLYSFMSYLDEDRSKNETKNSPYAKARKVATLKSYYKYIYKKLKLVDENIAEELDNIDLPKTQPRYLTLEESIKLLGAVNKKSINFKRDYCIITLFLHTGMRLSELESMRFDSIKGDILTIIGKGKKERTVYLNETCLKAITDYLIVRDNYSIQDGRMFNIKKKAIENIVKNNIVKAGIENAESYSCHKLRHTASMLMYKHGDVGIAELKDILGHTNISTTNIYAHADNDTLRKAVKNNPLNNL